MKRIIICLALLIVLLITVNTMAVDQWNTTNQATLAWTHDPGNIAFAGERFTNVVYLANYDTDPGKTNPVEVARTPNEQATVTIGIKGRYLAGIKVILEVLEPDGVTWTQVNESVMNWSDDPIGNENSTTFGIRFYPAPNAPGRFRPM